MKLLLVLFTSLSVLFWPQGPAQGDDSNSGLVEKNINLLPVPVLFFTPETGTGAGGGVYITYDEKKDPAKAHAKMPGNKQNLVVPFFVYTEKKQSVARLYWDLWSQDQKSRLYAVLGYTNYPDSFFGVGNNTKRADEEMFREVYGAADFDFEQLFATNTFVGINLRSDNFEILEKQTAGKLERKKSSTDSAGAENRDILGTNSGTIQGVGLQLRYLSINHPFTPTAGSNIILRNIQYGGAVGGQYRYTAQELRVKRYFLVMGKNSIAWELLVQRSFGEVPFRKLPMLGGQSLLRGFFLGRFRDNVLQSIQTEYRHIVNGKVGINLFLSEGAVGTSLQEVFKQPWHVTAGIGFRYIIVNESNLGLRLDIARTREDTSLYFGAGEAF